MEGGGIGDFFEGIIRKRGEFLIITMTAASPGVHQLFTRDQTHENLF